MKWEMVRRLLVIGGVLYAVALVPSSIRPSWTAAPFRKADQTITLHAASPAGQAPTDLHDKIKSSCKAAWVVRPIMGSAHRVRVVLTWRGHAVSVHEYECELFA